VIIDQIENMLKIMTSFELKPINDRLSMLTPSFNSILRGIENMPKLVKEIPDHKLILDSILKILSGKASTIQIQEMEKQLSIMSQNIKISQERNTKQYNETEAQIKNMTISSSKENSNLENQNKIRDEQLLNLMVEGRKENLHTGKR
jgi:hypothetical protein